MLLIFAIMILMLGATASGNSNVSESMTLSSLNELNARNIVTRYFKDREEYLRSEANDFITAVPAMVRDENTHREKLQANDIVFINSEPSIESVNCNDNRAEVTVTEAVTYSAENSTLSETVVHKITVFLDEDKKPIVVSDEYREDYSNFYSCSFVLPAENVLEPMAGGSGNCIVNVAKAEVGYTESGTNVTKYGSWYGMQDEWCAIFVAWCANQANIATSIIPKVAVVPTMKNFYSQNGRYHLSQSQGGTTTPKVGDLYFEGTSYNSVSHIGIIAAVDSYNVYVVDGNYNDRVNYREVSRTSSKFVGFARPQYASTSHNAGGIWYTNASSHWHHCTNCDIALTKYSHTFYASGAYYICSICGYKATHVGGISGGKPIDMKN